MFACTCACMRGYLNGVTLSLVQYLGGVKLLFRAAAAAVPLLCLLLDPSVFQKIRGIDFRQACVK
jgi:hypothetical protein